ncbi:MAG: YncE family protein, partial [Dehalococcoidia bacterium]|nr:YncE family protein [Dehalococcoidia bacterium]
DAKAYVINHGSSEVSVVDVTSRKVLDTIPVGKNPFGVALSSDGRRVYVSIMDENMVSVIDAGNHKITATIPVGEGPRGLALK